MICVGHRTAQWDEEIWAWKPGHGPKDTFCAEHSAGRPEAEFEPVEVEKKKPRAPVNTAAESPDASSSSSSSDDDDDDDDDEDD